MMADDYAGLLDELGIEKARVVGCSMGSIIAQQLALRHPDKVQSDASVPANAVCLSLKLDASGASNTKPESSTLPAWISKLHAIGTFSRRY